MKSNIKLLTGFVLGIIVCGTTVYAVNTIINANEVGYEDHTNIGVTNVQDAIDNLYQAATKRVIRDGPLCIRANTLHTEICNSGGYGCLRNNYNSGDVITYGSLGSSGTLSSGDAFDCDVNGDEIYDSKNERFYYVTDLDTNTAVLIYNNFTKNGVANSLFESEIAYNLEGVNNKGPKTAVENLPTTSQWVTKIKSPRQIVTDTNATSTGAGAIELFSYDGRAARLLTIQEVVSVCAPGVAVSDVVEKSSYHYECDYMFENSGYALGNGHIRGSLFETPKDKKTSMVYGINMHALVISAIESNTVARGVRPAIEVLKSDIQM